MCMYLWAYLNRWLKTLLVCCWYKCFCLLSYSLFTTGRTLLYCVCEICSLSLCPYIRCTLWHTEKETTKKNVNRKIYIKLKIQIRSRLPITKENTALIMSNISNSKGFTVITSEIHRQVNIKVFLLIFRSLSSRAYFFCHKWYMLYVAVSNCKMYILFTGKSQHPSLPRQTRQQCMIV